jgi:hypothetical protein
MRCGKVEAALSSLSKKFIFLAEPNSQSPLFRMEWQSISILLARKFKPRKLSTYKNSQINSREINTSKMNEFKSTKMNTCKKWMKGMAGLTLAEMIC